MNEQTPTTTNIDDETRVDVPVAPVDQTDQGITTADKNDKPTKKRRRWAIGIAAITAAVATGLGVGTRVAHNNAEAPEFPTTPAASAEVTPGATNTSTSEPSEASTPIETVDPSQNEVVWVGDMSAEELASENTREEQLALLGLEDKTPQELVPTDFAKIKIDVDNASYAPYTVGDAAGNAITIPFTLENTGRGAAMSEKAAKAFLEKHPDAAQVPLVGNYIAATVPGEAADLNPWDSSALDHSQTAFGYGVSCERVRPDGSTESTDYKGGFDKQVLNGGAQLPTELGTFNCSVVVLAISPNTPGATQTFDLSYAVRQAVLADSENPQAGVTTDSFGGSVQVGKTITVEYADDGTTIKSVK